MYYVLINSECAWRRANWPELVVGTIQSLPTAGGGGSGGGGGGGGGGERLSVRTSSSGRGEKEERTRGDIFKALSHVASTALFLPSLHSRQKENIQPLYTVRSRSPHPPDIITPLLHSSLQSICGCTGDKLQSPSPPPEEGRGDVEEPDPFLTVHFASSQAR